MSDSTTPWTAAYEDNTELEKYAQKRRGSQGALKDNLLRCLIVAPSHTGYLNKKISSSATFQVLLQPHVASGDPACHAGDMDSIPGWRRSPGEGNGNPPQYSCLETPVDRGARRVTKSWT